MCQLQLICLNRERFADTTTFVYYTESNEQYLVSSQTISQTIQFECVDVWQYSRATNRNRIFQIVIAEFYLSYVVSDNMMAFFYSTVNGVKNNNKKSTPKQLIVLSHLTASFFWPFEQSQPHIDSVASIFLFSQTFATMIGPGDGHHILPNSLHKRCTKLDKRSHLIIQFFSIYSNMQRHSHCLRIE